MGAANRCFIFATLLLVVVVQAQLESKGKECVPVDEVTALLFNQNTKTNSWKGQSAYQLECMDGCDSSAITRVFCQKEDPSPDDDTVKFRNKLEKFRKEKKDMNDAATTFRTLIDQTPENNKKDTDQLIQISQEFVGIIEKCRPGAIHLPKSDSLFKPLRMIASDATVHIANLLSWTRIKHVPSSSLAHSKETLLYCSAQSPLRDNDSDNLKEGAKSILEDVKRESKWMCGTTGEEKGNLLDELNIFCESCESQTWSSLVPGSCRLHYKQKIYQSDSDDLICRAISYVKKWGEEALGRIMEDIQKCQENDFDKCVEVLSRVKETLSNINRINNLWNYTTSLGDKAAILVTWKMVFAAAVTITAAGITYSVLYCWNESPTSNIETVKIAHLKLI